MPFFLVFLFFSSRFLKSDLVASVFLSISAANDSLSYRRSDNGLSYRRLDNALETLEDTNLVNTRDLVRLERLAN